MKGVDYEPCMHIVPAWRLMNLKSLKDDSHAIDSKLQKLKPGISYHIKILTYIGYMTGFNRILNL